MCGLASNTKIKVKYKLYKLNIGGSMGEGENERKEVKPDICLIALDEALNVVYEKCGRERAIKEIAKLIGLNDEEVKQINPTVHCKEVLDKGLNENVCKSFRGIRSWVMCRAFQLIEEEELSFSGALKKAWSEARSKCIELGVPL